MTGKNRLLIALAITAVIAPGPPAIAQFGGLKLPTISAGGGGGADIDGFLISTEQARHLTRVSAVALLESVASHDEAVRIEEEQKAADGVTDPKEREAALTKVSDDASAQLATIDYDAKAKEFDAKATAAQRHHLAVSIFNLALGILKDKDAAVQAHAITQSASRNPMMMATQAPKLMRVRDAVSAIAGQMGNLGTIANGLPKLMSVAKLQALPASSTDQPMSADL